MPLVVSKVMASCVNRPMPLIGRALEVPWAGTSNTQPWVCSSSSPFSSLESSLSPFSTVVSSQLSQLPQGVGPPAQFRTVPLKLGQDRSSLPVLVLKTRFVQPPLPNLSYAAPALPNAFPEPLISWFRQSVTVSPSDAITAMPSCESGVGLPSESSSPVQPNDV